METKKKNTIPVLLAIVGLIFLVGGASAYFWKVSATSVCEACDMEVDIHGSSTHVIICDSVTRYGCCPICALAIATYHENATISVQCFSCDKEIIIFVEDRILLQATPSGTCVIFGDVCMRNKIVCGDICCGGCDEVVRYSYDWAKDLPLLTIEKAFLRSRMMIGTELTITPGQNRIQIISYALILTGIVLFASALTSLKIMRRKLRKDGA